MARAGQQLFPEGTEERRSQLQYKELHARQRGYPQSEEAMYGQLDTLYQDVLASQTLWTSAATSMASQEAAFQAASNKLAWECCRARNIWRQSGLHGCRRCQRKGADTGFQQAMDTYDWALKGFHDINNDINTIGFHLLVV